jgi:hypothetical protein
MKKLEDLNPLGRDFTTDVNRLLLPLFLVSSAPSPEAKEPSPQAGNVRLTIFLFRSRLADRQCRSLGVGRPVTIREDSAAEGEDSPPSARLGEPFLPL